MGSSPSGRRRRSTPRLARSPHRATLLQRPAPECLELDPGGSARRPFPRNRARAVTRRAGPQSPAGRTSRGAGESCPGTPTEEAMSPTDRVDMKLEVVVIPVRDVDRAAAFYEKLGWRKDRDAKRGDPRLLQFTPPGSGCSIIFGTGITPSPPGSYQLLHLVVSDIVAARGELVAKGVDASEVFHDAAGGYN